jgi:signal peptide peptidase SppA
MTHLARIAEKVFNRPLLLHPQKAEVILWVLSERVGVTVDKPTPEENRFVGSPKYVNRQKLYGVQDGAAIITIEGSLVNRGEWIGAASGLVSYEGIEAQVSAALADANVSSIVLDIDSPGGEATGMYALAAKIRSARQIKPVVALVNDLAASAAYGIASQADQILVSPTSVVGSVGVVLLHLDVSKQMEMKGQVPTLIYAGAHKVDGNPFAPLPDTVKADLQRDVMTFYDRFVETVAAGRGDRISESAIRATEARTFIG